MFTRRLPITLGVVMFVLLVALIVGWVLLAVLASDDAPTVSWTVLSIGTVFYVLLLVGVSLYLSLSIKAVNLNRRQSNFIDSVTHELKSPIASMKLYLQTLNRHHVGPEQQADFHRAMLEDIERLDQLTDQMLDAGRLETNVKPDDLEKVSLGPVLGECAETARLRYHAAADTIALDLQPCTLRARRVDLEVIFRNLLDNAVKYAGEPPRVNVTLRSDGNGRAIVRVCDNGRGIPHKHAPQDLRPVRPTRVGIGTRPPRHRLGTLHRPDAGPPAPRPGRRPRSARRLRRRVSGGTAGQRVRRRQRRGLRRHDSRQAHSRGRGRSPSGHRDQVQPRGRGLPRDGRGRRADGPAVHREEPRGQPGDPRPDAARHERLHGVRVAARRGPQHAGPDAHRPDPRRRPRPGIRRRGRPVHDEAVRPGRVPQPDQEPDAVAGPPRGAVARRPRRRRTPSSSPTRRSTSPPFRSPSATSPCD